MRRVLKSFDGTEVIQAEYVRPDRYSRLIAALTEGGAVIARGAGLTYCAASSGPGVRTVSSELFNRVLAFDDQLGFVEVEPGVRLGDLYRLTTPRGWMLPVMPGHPSITVGGCIGCNVHGKNQRVEGNFIATVERLTLFHPDHGEFRCSRSEEPDLFRLTVGGFGLTGFITSARLRLRRITGSAMCIRRVAVLSLAETVAVMESEGKDAELLYSWNDFNHRGRFFGRGFVYIGGSGDGRAPEAQAFRSLSPEGLWRLPINAYGRWSTRWMLSAYRRYEDRAPVERWVDLATAVFPPNGREFYFSLFGQAGFREYQLLVPRARWPDAEDALPRVLRQHAVPITLGSLKLFRGITEFLNFDGTGVCVTIDAPWCEATGALFARLDEVALSLGALVNLAKDGRVQGALVARLYPDYERFRSLLNAFDRNRRLDSALRRRLGV